MQIGEYVLFPTRCWGTFGSLFIFFVTYFSNNEFSKKKNYDLFGMKIITTILKFLYSLEKQKSYIII